MRKEFVENKNKAIYVDETSMILINYFEDEAIQEFNIKRGNPNSPVPDNVTPKFIDINILEENEQYESEFEYLYNPIMEIQDDDEVFELVDIILRESDNNIPGSRLLLSTIIFYVIKYRPDKDKNLNSVLQFIRTVYSPSTKIPTISGMDYLMSLVKEEDPKGITSRIYSGFKALPKEKQDEIAVLLFENLIPFQLKKYEKFNTDIKNNIELEENEFPCYMLYFKDYENCIQDKIMSKLFILQHEHIK